MWEDGLPELSDHLRQGDLLDLQPMPKRGRVSLTPDGLSGVVRPNAKAVVLDRCCTVENKFTVQLAKVGEVRELEPDHRMMQALRNHDPQAGSPYAYYEHLLMSRDPRLPQKPGRLWVIQLLERVSIPATDHEELAPLRARRVARMTVLARAQLRAKLVAHWGKVEDEDAKWLEANGYDVMGRPLDG